MDSNRFGEKIRTLRKQHSLTLKQLADILGIKSIGYLTDIENGNKKNPSISLILKISHFFDVSIDQLLKDDLELD